MDKTIFFKVECKNIKFLDLSNHLCFVWIEGGFVGREESGLEGMCEDV